MKIKEVLSFLETKYPLYYQEDFDNCGIQCGDKELEITGALVCFEMTEETIDEAIQLNANLVISHHPLILRKGIQKIEPTHRVGRVICKAIENKMVLYSMHTNLDSAAGGVNDVFAQKLNLQNVQVLCPQSNGLQKIAFFVPKTHAELVRNRLFEVGAGKLGEYENCAYSVHGTGCFKPLDTAHPFVGQTNRMEFVEEERVEMVFPRGLQRKIVQALYEIHPYEMPAFDIYTIENESRTVGLGRVGELPEAMDTHDFLQMLKRTFDVTMIRYYGQEHQMIRRVALCGGGGSAFIGAALAAGADAYVCGDIKYHDFHTVDKKMLIADIGHLESEHFIKEIIFNLLKEKFANFATSLCESENLRICVI